MIYIHPEAFPIETKAPGETCLLFLTHIPSHQNRLGSPSVLGIGLRSYGTILNGLTELFIHWLSLQVDTSLGGRYLECLPKDLFPTNSRKPSKKWDSKNEIAESKNFGLDLSRVAVVLVGRLGQAGHVGLFGHRLAIRHHWVAHNEVTLGILVFPWVNPRFQNHPRLEENLDWMIPIGPSWVKRNAIFWGAIFIFRPFMGARKIHCCFAWKEKKLTARLKSASPRADFKHTTREKMTRSTLPCSKLIPNLSKEV